MRLPRARRQTQVLSNTNIRNSKVTLLIKLLLVVLDAPTGLLLQCIEEVLWDSTEAEAASKSRTASLSRVFS